MSPVALLTLSNEPAQLSSERQSEKLLRLADFALWQGDLAKAAGLVDTLLAAQTSNVLALRLKADLLSLQGHEPEAFQMYNQAMNYFFQGHNRTQEPPIGLIQKQKLSASRMIFGETAVLVLRAFVANQNLVLQWPAAVGQFYQVESTADFVHWMLRASNIIAVSNPQTWTTDLTTPMQFFRVSTSGPAHTPALIRPRPLLRSLK